MIDTFGMGLNCLILMRGLMYFSMYRFNCYIQFLNVVLWLAYIWQMYSCKTDSRLYQH
jgi:hypothetical protein